MKKRDIEKYIETLFGDQVCWFCTNLSESYIGSRSICECTKYHKVVSSGEKFSKRFCSGYEYNEDKIPTYIELNDEYHVIGDDEDQLI